MQIFLKVITLYVDILQYNMLYKIYTCRFVGILPSATSLALACLLFIILRYCFALKFEVFSSGSDLKPVYINCIESVLLFSAVLKLVIYYLNLTCTNIMSYL